MRPSGKARRPQLRTPTTWRPSPRPPWRARNFCRNSTLLKTCPRGNDPVYAFGTRLRQRQFTQADFALNALNFPQPIGNFSTRFSGSWMAFDSFKTQKEIRRADLFKESASSSAKATDQQIVFRVVGAYQSSALCAAGDRCRPA